MILQHFSNNGSFAYLWLKSVKDVDLSQHCAKCLIGDYQKEVKGSTKQLDGVQLNDNIYYLCGVARPFNWTDNFHLAFMHSPGNVLEYEDKGIHVVIHDAVMLPVSDMFVDPQHPKAKLKTYHTCRNWQFAHYFNQYLKQP